MPDLLPGNEEAWEILNAGSSQLRVGGMGGIVGFDYPALKMLADSYGFETPPAFWKKVRAVEVVIHKLEEKRSKQHNVSTAKPVSHTKRR